ncbi:hypothetical protein RclHR1_00080011 [Rhizophagus clarus]|uniref:C2H2-type domain-containing protein n=1 Tax=Rhizophagus clarus TaxID=94130 RepID=A0A2Z6RZB2_9GLOM|nr:hypothetical protein RclHR1_00080011 [Rhizophagus clarus]GET04065.1 hypothetical protein GLOIN_2v1475059 [Rhizophagus clarus]
MRRERRPTKKDFKRIIYIFQVDDEKEIYIIYKWNKASSKAIMTMEDAKKCGFEPQIDAFLNDEKIIKKNNKEKEIILKRLSDPPKYYCGIEKCYKKFNSSTGRDKHENSHKKKANNY